MFFIYKQFVYAFLLIDIQVDKANFLYYFFVWIFTIKASRLWWTMFPITRVMSTSGFWSLFRRRNLTQTTTFGLTPKDLMKTENRSLLQTGLVVCANEVVVKNLVKYGAKFDCRFEKIRNIVITLFSEQCCNFLKCYQSQCSCSITLLKLFICVKETFNYEYIVFRINIYQEKFENLNLYFLGFCDIFHFSSFRQYSFFFNSTLL